MDGGQSRPEDGVGFDEIDGEAEEEITRQEHPEKGARRGRDRYTRKQPAVSAQLIRLEEDLGVKLWSRPEIT